MPATISMEEGIALAALADLLRKPERYGCRLRCSTPGAEQTVARNVTEAIAIIDDIPAKNVRFPRS